MKNWLVAVSFIVGVMAGAGAVYVFLQDSESINTDQHQESTEAPERDNFTEQTSVEFTNQYRGAGDRNGYAEQQGEPVIFAITTREELNLRWSEMFATGLAPPKPAVDFESQIVIVAMSEQKATGGYQATVKSINYVGGTLTVVLEDKSPGNACFNTQALTRPVHIVAIGKIDVNNIELETTEASAAPCAVPLN